MDNKTPIQLAIELRMSGQWHEAVTLLESRTENSDLNARLEIGYCYFYGSKFEEALRTFEKIHHENEYAIYQPFNSEIEIKALFGEALILEKIGEFDDAIFFHKIVQKKSNSSSPLHIRSQIELGQIYMKSGDFEKALLLAISAQRKTEDNLDRLTLSEAMILQSEIKWMQGEFNQALHDLVLAEAIKQEFGDKKGIIKVKNTIAAIHEKKGDFDKAEQIFQEIGKLVPEINDPMLNAYVLANIALTKRRQGNYKEARDLYERTLQELTVLDDRQGLTRVLENYGILLSDMGDQGKAIESFRKCAEFREEMGDRVGLATITGAIARTQYSLGQLILSREFFRQSLDIYEETKSEIEYVTNLTAYAELLMTLEELDTSKKMIDLAFTIAKKHDSTLEMLKCQLSLAIYQIYRENFGHARKILRETAITADNIKAYEETIKVYILLAELGILRFQVTMVDADIDEAMEKIVIAEELADRQGLLPQFLDILVIKATLYSLKLQYDIAVNTLVFVRNEAENKHLIAHQQRAEILLERFKQRTEFRFKRSPQETLKATDETLSAIKVALKHSRERIPLKSGSTSIILFEILGGVAANFITSVNYKGDKAMLAQIGVYFSLALSQGRGGIPDGLYGPLPTPDEQDRSTLVYSETILDNTLLACFIYPKDTERNFIDRKSLVSMFSAAFHDVFNKANIDQVLSYLQAQLEVFPPEY